MSNPSDKESQDNATDSTQRIPEELRRDSMKGGQPRTRQSTDDDSTRLVPAAADSTQRISDEMRRDTKKRPPRRARPADDDERMQIVPAAAGASAAAARPARATTTDGAATAAAAKPGLRRIRKRRTPTHIVDPAITREGSLLGPMLLGLLLLGLIAWLAIKHYSPHIERDLLRRSTESLQQEGLSDSAFVEIDGRNAVLKGRVASREDRQRAAAVVGDTFGIRTVDNQLSIGDGTDTPVAARQESTFSLQRNGDAINLSGTVSAQHYADALQQSAAETFGADNVSSDIKVESGKTNPGWMPAIPALLTQMSNVEQGEISIADGTITLTGSSDSNATRDAIDASANELVGSLLNVDNQIASSEPQAADQTTAEPEPAAAPEVTPEPEVAPEPEPTPEPEPAAEPEPAVEPVEASLGIRSVGDKTELRGTVASDATRQALLDQAAVAFGADKFTDSLIVDENATDPQWIGQVGNSLAELKSLKHGSLAVGNGAAFLTGTTDSPSMKAAIEETMASAFGDEIDFQSNVMAIPDRTASLLIKNTSSEIALSGNLPPDSASQILDSISAANPNLDLIDLINVDDRVIAPDWIEPLAESMGSLSGITEPAVQVTDSGELILSGEAESEQLKADAASNVAGLFSDSVSLRNDMTVKKPTIIEPQPVDINELLSGIDLTGIRFGSNSAEVTDESLPVLDAVADALAQVPNTNLEIGGHTDSRGDYNYNVDLSRARAEAVRRLLASRGIADERMVATGYGPDSPIATNETRAGRATNRRIEFKIITGD